MVAVAEAQVEGCDPGHGPGRRLHDQITALAAQQREERRHVRQPAARPSEHTHSHSESPPAGIKTHNLLVSNAAFNYFALLKEKNNRYDVKSAGKPAVDVMFVSVAAATYCHTHARQLGNYGFLSIVAEFKCVHPVITIFLARLEGRINS